MPVVSATDNINRQVMSHSSKSSVTEILKLPKQSSPVKDSSTVTQFVRNHAEIAGSEEHSSTHIILDTQATNSVANLQVQSNTTQFNRTSTHSVSELTKVAVLVQNLNTEGTFDEDHFKNREIRKLPQDVNSSVISTI